MSDDKSRYCVAHKFELEDLESTVNCLVKEGWQPHSSPVFVSVKQARDNGSGSLCGWFQAMVKL